MVRLVTYKVCAGVGKGKGGKEQHVRPVHVGQVEEDDMGPLYVLQAHNRVPPLKVTVELDSHPVSMEVDRGSLFPGFRSHIQRNLTRQEAGQVRCEAVHLIRRIH